MPTSMDVTAKIKEVSNVEELDVRINKVANIDPLRISDIAPAAIHVKELNNIDPISLEPLRVNEVKNIDPITVEEFNVTRLPTVNLSVRQLPAVDMNVRRLPPVSLGFHQDIHIPSDYQVRARFFGVEFFRLNMTGHTTLIPKDKARREQAKSHEKSFPEVATAGNPAIPTRHSERTSVYVTPCPPHSHPREEPPAYHGAPEHHHHTDATMHHPAYHVGSRPPSFSLNATDNPSTGSISNLES